MDIDRIITELCYMKALDKSRNPKMKHIKNTKLKLPSPFVLSYVTYWLKKNALDGIDGMLDDEIEYYYFQQFISNNKEYTAKLGDLTELYQAQKDLSRFYYTNRDELLRDSVFLLKDTIGKIFKNMILKSKDLQEIQQLIKDEKQKCINGLEPTFENFKNSTQYIEYIRWKYIEITLKPTPIDFYIHRLLGYGGFADVYAVSHVLTGKMFAMKRVDKKLLEKYKCKELAISEKNIMKNIECDFIVNLSYSFEDKRYLYLIMKHMAGGDLHFHIKQKGGCFHMDEVKFYSAQIILALEYLHSRGITHMDIKPHNVLLDDEGNSRLSDMGLSWCNVTEVTTTRGTKGYMAPEIIKNENISHLVDYFSLGCTIVKMAIGISVLDTKYKYSENLQLKPDFLFLRKRLTKECFLLVYGLLQDNPAKRLGSSSNGINDIKYHEMFSDTIWIKMLLKQVPPPIRPSELHVNSNSSYLHCPTVTKHFKPFWQKVTFYYNNFNYVHRKSLRQEILDTIFTYINTKYLQKGKNRHLIINELKLIRNDPHILCFGEIWKRSKYFFKNWKRRIIVLYTDRIHIMTNKYILQIEHQENSIFVQLWYFKKWTCVVLRYENINMIFRGNTNEETEWLYRNMRDAYGTKKTLTPQIDNSVNNI